MTEKEKMLLGEWFTPADSELSSDRDRTYRLMHRMNVELDGSMPEYKDVFRELCCNSSPDIFIRAPFYCDYGYNIFIGKRSFVNFGCIFIDLAPIRIGEHCLIGPNVQLLTAHHPMNAAERMQNIEKGKAITIGDNCWLGGGVVVCPGVSIGDGCVIGAGSVVTKDIPSGSTAAGNPARVIRTEEDNK